ncbi:hypothetical protein K1T71_007744 [Dendrolimus kikuchii]|uniref:Uncharacterized protein n=1 Tax=Dendrolimus kikuchii TaxID=765133 RepID=A0ACC1CY61_9NEOP|nr:hypothetical protein K1T71_007744 [Dendrolimus kikuchii]
MADKKYIFRDVSVVNRFNTGSDHRLVRGTLNINFKAERLRLVKSTLRPSPPQMIHGSEQFQLELHNRFESLETTGNVDEITDNVIKTLQDLGHRHFPPVRRNRRSELSTETLDLMKTRREMPPALFASAEHRALSKKIRKLVRWDLRCSNTRAIEAAIEQNRGSKVFARSLRRSHIAKLRTADGRELTSRSEILTELEKFYGLLNEDPRAPLTRHYTEVIPEVDVDEISAGLGQLKNGKAPGDDGITTELLKAGGMPILKALAELFNSVIHRGTAPKAWSKSVVVLFFKKGDNTLLKNQSNLNLTLEPRL